MQLMSAKDIAELTGYTERHVSEKLIFRKDFPDCFNLGRKGRRWEKEDIYRWIRSQRGRA